MFLGLLSVPESSQSVETVKTSAGLDIGKLLFAHLCLPL